MDLSLGPARGDFARCGFCRSDGPIRALEGVPALLRCDGCDARYHARCLDELGGCRTPGCPAPLRSARVVLVPPPAPAPKPKEVEPVIAADPEYEARVRRLAAAREAAGTYGPELHAKVQRIGAFVGACLLGGGLAILTLSYYGPVPAVAALLLGGVLGAIAGHWFMWMPDRTPGGVGRWRW